MNADRVMDALRAAGIVDVDHREKQALITGSVRVDGRELAHVIASDGLGRERGRWSATATLMIPGVPDQKLSFEGSDGATFITWAHLIGAVGKTAARRGGGDGRDA